MRFRSACVWHADDPAIVEVTFARIPGWVDLRVWQHDFCAFHVRGWGAFTKRNELRVDTEWGPGLIALDLDQRAVRVRHFPYQITVPDRWHHAVPEGEP